MTEQPSAVVTGAGGGIGGAAAARLAADGFRVWLADVDLPAATRAADGIAAAGGWARALHFDVSSEDSVTHAFSEIAGETDRLDALVNCAAVISTHRFDDIPADAWRRTHEVNVIGTYLCIREALPLLREAAPPSRIVNLASGAAKLPGPYTTPYHASKAAVISLTRSAAAAFAPDILVNCVCPGVIDTPMWETIDRGLEVLGAPESARFASRASMLPIRRAGTSEEVADVISFLASRSSRYMTGEDVNVTGGSVMH